MTHWLTKFDEEDGEPYGEVCDCEIAEDHNGAGGLTDPVDDNQAADRWDDRTNALIHYITGGQFL